MKTIWTGPYTADIGDGIESFETLADLQRAMRVRVSGIRSSSEWYRHMRSRHGAKARDAAGEGLRECVVQREVLAGEWGEG